jgi:hypothetical protein
VPGAVLGAAGLFESTSTRPNDVVAADSIETLVACISFMDLFRLYTVSGSLATKLLLFLGQISLQKPTRRNWEGHKGRNEAIYKTRSVGKRSSAFKNLEHNTLESNAEETDKRIATLEENGKTKDALLRDSMSTLSQTNTELNNARDHILEQKRDEQNLRKHVATLESELSTVRQKLSSENVKLRKWQAMFGNTILKLLRLRRTADTLTERVRVITALVVKHEGKNEEEQQKACERVLLFEDRFTHQAQHRTMMKPVEDHFDIIHEHLHELERCADAVLGQLSKQSRQYFAENIALSVQVRTEGSSTELARRNKELLEHCKQTSDQNESLKARVKQLESNEAKMVAELTQARQERQEVRKQRKQQRELQEWNMIKAAQMGVANFHAYRHPITSYGGRDLNNGLHLSREVGESPDKRDRSYSFDDDEDGSAGLDSSWTADKSPLGQSRSASTLLSNSAPLAGGRDGALPRHVGRDGQSSPVTRSPSRGADAGSPLRSNPRIGHRPATQGLLNQPKHVAYPFSREKTESRQVQRQRTGMLPPV